MPKEKFIQLLNNLPANSKIKAKFSYDRVYANSYDAVISGISLTVDDSGALHTILCLAEAKSDISPDTPF